MSCIHFKSLKIYFKATGTATSTFGEAVKDNLMSAFFLQLKVCVLCTGLYCRVLPQNSTVTKYRVAVFLILFLSRGSAMLLPIN